MRGSPGTPNGVPGDPRSLLSFRRGHLRHEEVHPCRGADHLHRLAVALGDRHPQRVVPCDERAQCRMERPGDEPFGDRVCTDEGLDHVATATQAYGDERIYRWLLARELPQT